LREVRRTSGSNPGARHDAASTFDRSGCAPGDGSYPRRHACADGHGPQGCFAGKLPRADRARVRAPSEEGMHLCVAVQIEIDGQEAVSGRAQCQAVDGLKLRRAMASDRGALIAMYLSFEPKGAALGLPPRKDVESWLDRLSVHPNFLASIESQ